MTNSKLMREKIEESGLKQGHIAKKLNLSLQGLINKIDNESEFKASEIKKLRTILNLNAEESENIFFA